MEDIECKLLELVKESKEQVDNAIASICTNSDVPAEKVAVLLACRLEGDTSLLLCTLALMDALSLRIKTCQDVKAAEILGYLFRVLRPEQVMARACAGAASAVKARVKGYLKRWASRGCMTQQQCIAIIEAVDRGTTPCESEETTAVASGPPLAPATAVPKAVVEDVASQLNSLTALLAKVPLDVAVSVGERISKMRIAGLLPLESPTSDTIGSLKALVDELKAAEDKQNELEAAARRKPTLELKSRNVEDLAEFLSLRHGADTAAETNVSILEHAPSYHRWLESDVGGHVGRLTAQPGLEFLLAGRAAPHESAPYRPPRSEGIIRRPFRVPSRGTGGPGYYRAWGISDEQWAVEKDMSRIAVVKPRSAATRPAAVSAADERKRARE